MTTTNVGALGIFDQNLNDLLDEATNLTTIHATFKSGRKRRRIIFHSGPPNSGKTHDAIVDFTKAENGIYCCPLRLLAQEVAQKAKALGVDCDMITGEATNLAKPPEKSLHKACTVQLADLDRNYDVAIIDEIQMISDPQNGWAFTRAFLGLNARTLEVCGDECAYPLICRLAEKCGETVEKIKHIRPHRLQYFTMPLVARGRLRNVKEGDCIVCFSKLRVKTVARQIEESGLKTATIYGSLPPETKQSQIENFNSEEGEKKVLVATDAIGMGLNAQIQRVIFHDFYKHSRNRFGELNRRILTPLEFRQISGRAAREFSRYGQGYVMAAFSKQVESLRQLKEADVPNLQTAGLRPPVECITLFSSVMEQLYPDKSLQFDEMLNLYIDKLKTDESLYFLCTMEDVKTLSHELKDIPLKIEDRYNLCCAPIQYTSDTQKEILVKMARHYSQDKIVSADWIRHEIQWNKIERIKIIEMTQLDVFEDIYAILSLYNWMNNKFPLVFPDEESVNQMKEQIAQKITHAMDGISQLQDVPYRNESRKRSFEKMLEDTVKFEPDNLFEEFSL